MFRYPLAVSAMAVAFHFGLHASPVAASDGVRIVPVFGADRTDVSDQVDWFIARAGVVEKEIVSSVSGQLRGYEFSDRFSAVDEAGTFAGVTGEFGVKLDLPGHTVFARATAPDGATEIEIPVTGVGRVEFSGVTLGDDDLVAIGFSSSAGGGSAQLPWRQTKGFFYQPPGETTITFFDMTSQKETKATVTIIEGETTPFPVSD